MVPLLLMLFFSILGNEKETSRMVMVWFVEYVLHIGWPVLFFFICLTWQECETKIAQEIASLSKEDVSKEEMNENEEVINILLAQVSETLFLRSASFLFKEN